MGVPALLCVLVAAAVTGAVPTADPVGVEPVRHQDSLALTRLVSASPRADGLLTLGLGLRGRGAVHLVDGQRQRVEGRDYFFIAEASPLSGLGFRAEVPWRTWSGGTGDIPATGAGLGDGSWRCVLTLPGLPSRLRLAAVGGGNIPAGSTDDGLGEGVFSPRWGAAATFELKRGGPAPDMRLHLNAVRQVNRAEDTGYGMGLAGFQPAPPRYPSAAQAGGTTGNDAWHLGAALEFRRGTTSLWLEYGEERFDDETAVARREQARTVAAGLRWGVVEGLAVHGAYEIDLSRDDPATDWYPAFPDWSMTVAVTRQFSIGGRDRDGDGIVDRRDRCPAVAEDADGFEDGDGCPESDNDGDGIPDAEDAAPDLPEDMDGFEDEDGRPEPDNDGDGILDRDDLCPDEPEDMDGHHDDDGCPDDFLDRDGDGVEDRVDHCPDLAEDRDGFEDDDGCPEDDNDLDGIPDAEDGCPDEAEDYDGEADEDGCPDGPETDEG